MDKVPLERKRCLQEESSEKAAKRGRNNYTSCADSHSDAAASSYPDANTSRLWEGPTSSRHTHGPSQRGYTELKFDPDMYTVGWICAISTEYVAAQEFLDEKHTYPDFAVERHDDNDYTLGRIGKHNVVLAVMPTGQYGTNSAAVVARDMVRSFQNLRIAIMVGIGGGAPAMESSWTKRDIRLGDVVVSSPRDGQGGVYQYDYGKAIQDRTFHQTGHLNSPPKWLLSAVAGLRTQMESDGHTINADIEKVFVTKPRLRSKYSQPDPSTDRLYRSTYVHPVDDERACFQTCDSNAIISRPPRDQYEDNPTIHYGLVASGNSLMEDATIRDAFAEEKKVLCFEMEAAGLMSQFPFLIVRGICDYADSHKNKEWQGYAAMTAAAYTKKLLLRLAPTKVEAEITIQDAINSIEQQLQVIGSQVEHVQSDAHAREVQNWLHAPDPSTNYNHAGTVRHPGSGTWLLQDEAFVSWKDADKSSCLWLHGISGCGKTVLSSAVIHDLKSCMGDGPVLYFYFDFNDKGKQRLEALVRSLISQLSLLRHDCHKLLETLFSSYNVRLQQPSCLELRQLLLAMIKKAGSTWIVVDALDESTSHGVDDDLLTWLKGLINVEGSIVHLLATSRSEGYIGAALEGADEKIQQLSLQKSNIDEDIRSYLLSRLREDDGLKRWAGKPRIRAAIEDKVLREADGMFRLVACRLDLLRNCRSEYELYQKLANVPETLASVYQRMIEAIPQDDLPAAIRVLQLLVFSAKPLTATELSHAIAVETEQEPYFNPYKCLIDVREVAYYCPGLTVLVNSDTEPVLQLSHLSVKEYLSSGTLPPELKTSFGEQSAKLTLANVCVSYLLQLNNRWSPSQIRQRLPFAQYCARYWYIYSAVPRAKPDSLLPKILRLLERNGAHDTIYVHLHKMDRPFVWADRIPDAKPLYYASFAGLPDEVEEMIARGANVNEKGGRYGHALVAASRNGHLELARLLLDAGASVNARGSTEFSSALAAASHGGHQDVVRMLLERGAEVNNCAALLEASSEEHLGIMRLLLESGANIEEKWIQYTFDGHVHGSFTALLYTSAMDRLEAVQLLLSKGANPNARGYTHMTPLQAASREGHKDIVLALLENGADINAQGDDFGTALQAALIHGHVGIVQLLLDKGARDDGGNALEFALAGGYLAVVEETLQRTGGEMW